MVKKTASSNRKRVKLSFLLVLLGLSILITGAMLQNTYEQRKLEKEFNSIENSLNDLRLEDSGFKISKGCRDTVEKYAKGRTFCSVSLSKENTTRGDYSVLLELVEKSTSWSVANKSELQPGINYAQITYLNSGRNCVLDTTVGERYSIAIVCSEYTSKPFYPYQD